MTPRTILNALGDLVFVLDRDQRVTAAYGRWIQAERFKASRFTGTSIAEEWPPDIAALHIAMNARALDGQVVIYDWEYPVRGSGHRMMTLICPIYDKPRKGINGAIRISSELSKGLRPVATQALQLALQQFDLEVSPSKPGGRLSQRRVRGPANTPSDKRLHLSKKVESFIFRLSARERHIVGLLLDSARPPQIARALQISVHTVRQHLKHILKKANVHSQQELLELLHGTRPRSS